MSSDGGLTAKPLSNSADFNWVFLTELLTVGILTIFFLFYFNRLLSTLVSYAIRAYTWRAYRAYIDIQALQISFLGGRIFFKGIRYHAHNETIIVHGGFITWRYWLRKVREAEVYATPIEKQASDSRSSSSGDNGDDGKSEVEEKGGRQPDKTLPCRIQVKVSGLEAFIYNRSPVYDAIIENVARKNAKDRNVPEGQFATFEKDMPYTSPTSSSEGSKAENDLQKEFLDRATPNVTHAVYNKPTIPSFLKIFPIHVSCNKAAAVLGNENTRCVLTAKIDRADGVFDAGRAGPLDIYKQIFAFEVDHPVITMKPNVDFRELQLATAVRLKDEVYDGPGILKSSKRKRVAQFTSRKALHVLEKLSPHFRKSLDSIATAAADVRHRVSSVIPTIPGQERWLGLTRYLDEEQNNEHDEWESVEYAKYSTIADIPKVSFSFFWDIPGQVHGFTDDATELNEKDKSDINGTVPPEYGMELHIFGGTVNYGPWADRMRVDFQNIFFPPTFVDAEPTRRLSPGQYRLNTVFKLFLCVEEDISLRLPFRENSKDWRWKGQAESIMKSSQGNSSKGKGPMRFLHRDKASTAPTVRPFAWMDIRIAKDTTIKYSGDMYPREDGYKNSLIGDIKSTEIFSSVNHGLLWRSGAFALDLDISYPLGWKTLRDWRFDIVSNDLQMFIIRDHLFLLTDLILDWTSGPPQDYYTFVPYVYQLNLEFRNLKLYLNTNDANVINEPASIEDNHFIILYGGRLLADVRIPLDRLRPKKNEVPYKVRGFDFGLDMSMPPRSTLSSFAQHMKVATLDEFTLAGSHSGWTETSFSLTDTLTFDIHGTKFLIIFYGFLAHHFVRIKENYFGDDLHFRTLEEFQQLIADGGTNPDGDTDKISNRGNDLDVILSIVVDDASVIVPANVYNAADNVTIEVPFSNVDLRIGNYYMDLMLNISPISISLGHVAFENEIPINTTEDTQVFIDSVRFMGSRFFGLPPIEPAYCCNWDVDVGNISGECSEQLLITFARTAQAAIIGFPDAENTVPIPYPVLVHDVQFLQLRTKSIRLWLHLQQDAVLIDLQNTTVEFNDLAGEMFSGKVNVGVPSLTVACVDCSALPRHNVPSMQRKSIRTHAYFQTSVTVKVMMRQANFEQQRELQQAHIRLHDQRTNRANFLLLPLKATDQAADASKDVKVEPPAIVMPSLPDPLYQETIIDPSATSNPSIVSSTLESSRSSLTTSINQRRYLRRKGSDLSLAKSVSRSLHERMRHGDLDPQTSTKDSRRPSKATVSPQRSARGDRFANLPNQASYSVAFSSPLSAPYLTLDGYDLDLTELPPIAGHPTKHVEDGGDQVLTFQDTANGIFDPAFGHTSLIIAVNSELQGFLSPGAVSCGLNMLKIIQPQSPEDVIDSFHGAVLGRMVSQNEQATRAGASLDLALKVPAVTVRFFNHFGLAKDQLDVTLSPTAVSLRTVDFPVEDRQRKSLSMHILLDHLGISLREVSQDGKNNVAVQAHIDDILIWLVQKDSLSVNVSYKGLQIGSSSREIDYLANLVARYMTIAQECANQVEEQLAEGAGRLKFLAHSLTVAGKNVPDPSFLTRASYVMRSASGHVRQHDSWKIISRFRHIYVSLPKESQQILARKLAEPTFDIPADAQQQVLEEWDHWRAWDLAHVKNSSAMRLIYGDDGVSLARLPSNHFSNEIPLDLSIRCGSTGLIIDPGPKQSKFSISDLALMLSIVPSGMSKQDSSSVHHAKQSLRLQIGAKSAHLHVDWHIWHLVERITEVILHNDQAFRHLTTPAQEKNALSESVKANTPTQDMQIIVALGTALLNLKSNNLQSANVANDLKLSLLSSSEGQKGEHHFLNALMSSSKATASICSGKTQLLQLQSQSPTIFFSEEHDSLEPHVVQTIKLLGLTSAVLVKSQEEILGVIEVVDTVLRDEAAYVKRQIDSFKKFKDPNPKTTVQKKPTYPPALSIILTMDSFEVSVALLQSLSYSLVGSTGRFSIRPDLSQKFSLQVDVDLDKHKHYLQSRETFQQDIAVLELPEVNVRVLVIEREGIPRITASVIAETIQLDASALHGLVDTFRRPELSQTFDSITADIATLQQNIKRVFPSSEKLPSQIVREGPPVEYNLHFVLAGLVIQAATQKSAANSSVAKLTIGMDTTKVAVSNKTKDPNKIFPIPEVHAAIRQIFADMTVTDETGIRHCGDISVSALLDCTVQFDKSGIVKNDFAISSKWLSINLYAETASAVVDVMNHLQDKVKDLDLSRERRYLRRLQIARRHTLTPLPSSSELPQNIQETEGEPSALFESSLSVQLLNIQVKWIVGQSVQAVKGYQGDDLVFSIKTIDLATTSENTARLAIIDLQLALTAAATRATDGRPWNSALLPELVFNVAHGSSPGSRQLQFYAAGKLLDVQLEPKFMIPVSMVQRSITLAVEKFRDASGTWQSTPTTTGGPRKNIFGDKRLSGLIVGAEFAGAQLSLEDRRTFDPHRNSILLPDKPQNAKGKYGQFAESSSGGASIGASIRSPGLAVKVQYSDAANSASVLNVEIRLDASSNTLYPTIVPLIIDISNTVKDIVRQTDVPTPREASPPKATQNFLEESEILTADPSTVLGKIQLNVGFKICRQEFSLSCQPVARVAATAKFEEIYMTINSVRSNEQNHFFALSTAVEGLQASVQHVYSRESTFSFDAQSIVLSLINSKHLSGTAGISAILKVSPMRTQVNVRQLQDFLLFREIWFPREIRGANTGAATARTSATTAAPEEYLMQRYRQVSATAAFPWTATVAIEEMSVELDLGQAIGRSSLRIKELWASSKKSSDWEQTLCIGVGSIGADSNGRMSGLVELQQLRVRTTITWPEQDDKLKQIPRIQASAGFDRLRLKAAFDYQAFAISDITDFDFMMYNIKVHEDLGNDRLVAILNGGNIRAYITSTTASQVVALVQAFERLIQDNETAYTQSLRDVEKFLRRKSTVEPPLAPAVRTVAKQANDSDKLKAPVTLHTDVVVTLKSLSVGCFPSSFTDRQVLSAEALDIQARFAVALEDDRIHSALGMTLGQLRVALASIPHSSISGAPKVVGEIEIDEVVETVVKIARGGIILRVPKVIAAMQTWQKNESNQIEYIFKSSFEGKVDVGWNLSRISSIRDMWTTHSRTLAARLGKPVPETAVRITTAAEPVVTTASKAKQLKKQESETDHKETDLDRMQEKITAVVNVPQSGYEYIALEPPIIETPQLRDMGEATPPLEWIGLHRDRLPNVTHQIFIVTLLEIAKEVEDAYGSILGRS